MKTNKSGSVFKHVMAWLEAQGAEISKISVQKFLFFLQEKGEPLRYSFEPYTYGPFSKQVMEDADNLRRANEIVISERNYAKGEGFTDSLLDNRKVEIDQHLDRFSLMLNNNFTFNNLEVFGTTLYCLRALQESDLTVNRDSVVEEFKEWKGQKYSEELIIDAYEKLSQEFISE